MTRFKTPGLCETCRFARMIVSDRGSQFTMCLRSQQEPDLFPKYPHLPVLTCNGYDQKVGENADDQKIAVDQNK